MFKKAAVALAVPAAAIAIVIPIASAPASSPRAITLIAKLDKKSAVTVDAARPKGMSAGDGVVFSADLTRNGRAAGRAEFAQTVLDNRYEGVLVHAQLLLADGTLALQGAGTNKRPPGAGAADTQQVLAIVGGTGAYVGAGGSVRLTSAGPTSQRMAITLTS